ncbi:MAG: hypothetical protein F4213_17475 [Boseongicola sp. SB0677_bin_26]|nr:hypothetical protein [Boseongicola sp. SB0665_bin_10]MYG27785.1 hypothetical protein [Boseongicola sp. SB0677_bin_26]
MTAGRLQERSPYETDGDHLIGRDPRTVPADDWPDAWQEAKQGIRAIRMKCLDRCGGDQPEVRKCTVTTCPLWAFRMGSVPKALKRRDARRRDRSVRAEGEALRIPPGQIGASP